MIEYNDEHDNRLTEIIFWKLVDALKLSMNKYYYQSLTQLRAVTHIDQSDLAFQIAGIALSKTLDRFREVENLEERLLERFINKAKPLFELFEEDSNAAGDTDIVHTRELNRKTMGKYQESQQSQKSANAKRTTTDTEKYTFRCWMLRLGLIGEDFKTCRHHFLERLSGNYAWRHAC